MITVMRHELNMQDRSFSSSSSVKLSVSLPSSAMTLSKPVSAANGANCAARLLIGSRGCFRDVWWGRSIISTYSWL